MELALIILSIVIVGVVLVWYLNACPHSWKVIEKYHVKSKKDGKINGYLHVKKCEFCHKLKKEQINL